MRLHINRLEEWEEVADCRPSIRDAVRLALETAASPLPGEISITFVSEEEIRELNRRFLDRDEVTDVLAFELGDGGRLLGDVYVCPPVAARAATEAGIPLRTELIRLVIHGTLHLLGHDHPEGEDRWSSPMFLLQERLVAQLS